MNPCVFCSRNECRNLIVIYFFPFKIGQSYHEGLKPSTAQRNEDKENMEVGRDNQIG